MKVTVAVLDKKGENAPKKALLAIETLDTQTSKHFGLVTPKQTTVEQDIENLRTHNLKSQVAMAFASTQPPKKGRFEIQNYQNAALVFDATIYKQNPPTNPTEPFNSQRFTKDFVSQTEGDYALLTLTENQITAARDPIGIAPLHYGETEDVCALASNRSALWSLGVEDVRSFPPGNVGVASRSGFEFEAIRTWCCVEPVAVSLEDASAMLQRLLEEAVRVRLHGVERCAVAFSGGLDSSVVAFLVKQCGVDVELVHVSMENHPETKEAQRAAEALGLPLHVHLFTESDVENIVGRVVGLIEESDPVKAGVGVPFYWTAQKAAEAGLEVLLAGQGADELFGGYQRYVTEYVQAGEEKLREMMFGDVVGICESNLERDLKICGFHDVSLRLPFAGYAVVDFALGLPASLKVEPRVDSLRKLVLRRAALELGLPRSIAQKPKKAVQYSTGVSNVLKRLAKKQGVTLGEYVKTLFEKQTTVENI
ncbi:MAG: asparagine synthetase B [Candidatus Bathyarchaeota archaeon]|nr:asparagine synthetase B [Candidatus Bathyarchaeota archaeon]